MTACSTTDIAPCTALASAPGKVMLSGEYAVLRGAPALVLAVDRRVRVRLTPSTDWRASSDLEPGGASLAQDPEALPDGPAASLLRLLAARAGQGGPLTLDVASRALRNGEIKLGLGSSAAVSVAACAALAACGGQPLPSLAALIDFHDTLQGRAGSGADVACSLLGGLVAFRRAPQPTVERRAPVPLPMRFLWTGLAAATVDFIAGFESWAARPSSAALLADLDAAAQAVAAAPVDALAEHLSAYAHLTRRLHDDTGLPIYGAGHEALRKLAQREGVVYKPCGAGGGDLGVAACADLDRLEHFVGRARALDIPSVALTAEGSGVTVTRGDIND